MVQGVLAERQASVESYLSGKDALNCPCNEANRSFVEDGGAWHDAILPASPVTGDYARAPVATRYADLMDHSVQCFLKSVCLQL